MTIGWLRMSKAARERHRPDLRNGIRRHGAWLQSPTVRLRCRNGQNLLAEGPTTDNQIIK